MIAELTGELLALLDREAFCYRSLRELESRCAESLRDCINTLSAEQALTLFALVRIASSAANDLDAADGDSAAHEALEQALSARFRDAVQALSNPVPEISPAHRLIAAYYRSTKRGSVTGH